MILRQHSRKSWTARYIAINQFAPLQIVVSTIGSNKDTAVVALVLSSFGFNSLGAALCFGYEAYWYCAASTLLATQPRQHEELLGYWPSPFRLASTVISACVCSFYPDAVALWVCGMILPQIGRWWYLLPTILEGRRRKQPTSNY